jgi:hypothetical protein
VNSTLTDHQPAMVRTDPLIHPRWYVVGNWGHPPETTRAGVPPDGRQPARRAGYDVVPIDRSFRQNDLTMRRLRNGSPGAHEYQRTEIEVPADAPA